MSAIYIAARFSQRPECNALAHALMAQGHTITSRWVKPDADHVIPTELSAQAEDSERRRFAMEDCSDVRACDWIVSLQGEPRSGGRGGRHVEFGYALALGKRMISIGPRETVFHHLGEVEQFDTVEAFLAWSATTPATPSQRLDAKEGGGLHDHVRKMQEACANYIEPATYIARHPDTSKLGECAWVREFPMPDQHASEQGAAETNARRDQAFIRDMIYMLDGPEQRAAMSSTPSQRLDAATVERCAQIAEEDGTRWFRTDMGHHIGSSYQRTAARIRALATEPHQHGD